MYYIPLSGKVGKGKFAIVDDDYSYLSEYSWHLSHGYAMQNIYVRGGGGARKKLYLHHMVLPTAKPIDHINGDKLDNRRENLRQCTVSQNVANTGLRSTNTSGYKGVSYVKKLGKWRAALKRKSLGVFSTPELAAEAYRRAHVECYGEFSRVE